jgi:hypothetical protein
MSQGLNRSPINAENLIAVEQGNQQALPITVQLKPDAHFEPGFRVTNFPSSTFEVTLNGQVITQSSSPTTSRGVGRLIQENGTTSLLFQYLSQIPNDAPTSERTFVIEAED